MQLDWDIILREYKTIPFQEIKKYPYLSTRLFYDS